MQQFRDFLKKDLRDFLHYSVRAFLDNLDHCNVHSTMRTVQCAQWIVIKIRTHDFKAWIQIFQPFLN